MSLRKKPLDRCSRCYMRQERCICADIPVLDLKTKVVIVISKREFGVPTNTGRLAAEALSNSAVFLRGDLDNPYDLSEHLGPEGTNFVFYPSDDSEVLDADFSEKLDNRSPLTLIFPDGNWRGAGKMCRRDPVMARLPRVRLPSGAPSNYQVRKETKAEGLATIEAISRALGIVEGPEPQRQLDLLLSKMVEQTMQSRGALDVI